MDDYDLKLAKIVIAREVVIQGKNLGWTPYEVINEVIGCYNNFSDSTNWLEAEHVIYENLLEDCSQKKPLLDFIK